MSIVKIERDNYQQSGRNHQHFPLGSTPSSILSRPQSQHVLVRAPVGNLSGNEIGMEFPGEHREISKETDLWNATYLDRNQRITNAGCTRILVRLWNAKSKMSKELMEDRHPDLLDGQIYERLVAQAMENAPTKVRDYFQQVLLKRLLYESDDSLHPILAGFTSSAVLWLREFASKYAHGYNNAAVELESKTNYVDAKACSDDPELSAFEEIYQEFVVQPVKASARYVSPGTAQKAGQFLFTQQEDQLIVKTVNKLWRGLQENASPFSDPISSICKFVRSDDWSFQTSTHPNLMTIFNQLAEKRGLPSRPGSSLKTRWKRFAKLYETGMLPKWMFEDKQEGKVLLRILKEYSTTCKNTRRSW